MKRVDTQVKTKKMTTAFGYAFLVVVAAFCASAQAQQSVNYLNEGSIAIGHDGTIAGSSYGNNVKSLRIWSYEGGRYGDGGMTDIPGATSTEPLEVTAVADGGGVLVGGIGNNVLYWKEGQGFVSISSELGQAYDVSADGNVVVGFIGSPNTSAFRWENGTLTDLGKPGASTKSWAKAVSADGAVVVGKHGVTSDNEAAFRWEDGVMVDLGAANAGALFTEVTDLSGDGTVMVGYWSDRNTPLVNITSYRWTEDAGFTDLPALSNYEQNYAQATNVDGTVVVGGALDTDYSEAAQWRAWRWTEATNETQTIEDWLIAGGVTPAPGALAREATGVSGDGNVVTGMMTSGGQFIARVCPATGCTAGGGSGLITVEDFQQTIGAAAAGGSMALGSASMTFNGAHSRPLANRVEPGKNAFWTLGDWGVDKHGSRDGRMGLAEVGVGRNFGPVQMNVSLGYSSARQDFDFGGRAKTKGMYAMAEGLVPITGSLWGVVSLYRQWGDSTLNRGYLNAGNPDMSTGSPDMSAWGIRGRLQWDGMWELASSRVSPYIDLSYTQAKLDAYTETGGGFPARYDARRDKATELRLGFDVQTPLSSSANLITILEGVHRFEKHGDTIKGEVIGLFPFALDGEKYKQTWARGAVGVEGEVLSGVGSFMLNATTSGSAPSAWIAASWRMAF